MAAFSKGQFRYVTVVGDPNDVNTWSNIPYFFMRAGERRGFFDGGVPLKPERLRAQRWGWNLWTLLRTGAYGGFQYAPYFLDRLWGQVETDPNQEEFVSHFPLLPPKPAKRGYRVSYYIDATLKQNFEDYGVAKNVSPPVREQALAQERRNYHHADRVVCMCRWAATSVVEDYDVSPDQVNVVPGGANLRETDLPSVTAPDQVELRPLRLGFVGKNWRRKGLPFLLRVADRLLAEDIAVEVPVLGPDAADLPDHEAIEPHGFVDKENELDTFVDLVQAFHFGCLFSDIEASPRSNLECLRLGVPVLASDVGGIADTVPEGLGHLYAPDASPEAVASTLSGYLDAPDAYRALCTRIATRTEQFSWDHAVDVLQRIWTGEATHTYAESGRTREESGKPHD